MATYKLIQDIEAEDHILGPLTLRQFIFALLTAFLLYINFIVVAKGAAFLLAVFFPPALLTGFFAFPFGRDQPTEIWALAKLRFLFKPRKRIWNQSGVKDLVTITAPKKVEHVYTDGLSQDEVKSRLGALANTIDSRGWAIKNVNVNSFVPNPLAVDDSDRLISPSAMPQAVSDAGILASDDMLDEQNNPIARQFDAMIQQTNQSHHQELIDEMNSKIKPTVTTEQDAPWFMPPTAGPPIPVAATETPAEAALAHQIEAQHHVQPAAYGNLRTLQPLSNQPTAAPTQPPAPVPVNPAMQALADNDDLNISTIAREAHRSKGEDPGEIIVPLH